MIEKQSIEQLLERARLEEVAGQFLPDLSQRGANRKATCPFCQAKKGKFSISITKQLFKCFECNAGGHGALNYLIKARELKYIDAVKWLADFYKFTLEEVHEEGPRTTGTIDTSYFDQRMAELRYVQDRPKGRGLFSAHSSGGIEIRFPALREEDGVKGWQQHDGQDFVRTRLHPSQVTSTQKYTQPKDSGIRIFIPPPVVQLYREGTTVPTLFVVEGEFKAYVMAQQGVPIVGITGIQMYHRAKGSKELHPDLMELLRVLKPASAVIVHDADCKQVKWDPIAEPEKDLAKRLKDFASAVTGFRMALGALVQRVYFSHIRQAFATSAKGIDDLAQKEGAEEVSVQVQVLRTGNLFVVKDITDMTWRGINGEFFLNMHTGVPKAFYDQFQTLLGDRSFNFLGGIYRFDMDEGEGGKLMMERHKDSGQFVRVGCDYFRNIATQDEHGTEVRRLVGWKEAIINRDYVHKGFKNFYDTIEVYDAFDTAPAHHEDYKPYLETSTGRLYNRYKALSTQPKLGKWDTIKGYLQHVFGEHEIKSTDPDGNTVATSAAWVAYLDYLTIMYRFPRQRLPAVALVSEAKQTGKSKLLELNCAMWEGNATMMGNDQLVDEFNGDWVSGQFVGVDETLLDKKHHQEKMKRLITGTREQLRSMYKDREMTQLVAKFHFTSNNEDNFIAIDDDEMRYWVVKVPMPKRKDPMLLEKMVAEIPALFHELRTRAIVHPKISRLWFADSVIETEARRVVAANSKGWCEGEVRQWIEEEFYRLRWPELYFTIGHITKRINDTGTKFRMKEFRRVLENVMKVERRTETVIAPLDPAHRTLHQKIGDPEKQRWFVFRACDFINPADAAGIMEDAKSEWLISTSAIGVAGERIPMPLLLKHPAPEMELA